MTPFSPSRRCPERGLLSFVAGSCMSALVITLAVLASDRPIGDFWSWALILGMPVSVFVSMLLFGTAAAVTQRFAQPWVCVGLGCLLTLGGWAGLFMSVALCHLSCLLGVLVLWLLLTLASPVLVPRRFDDRP